LDSIRSVEIPPAPDPIFEMAILRWESWKSNLV
jgi:hypothetical protein